MRLLLESSIPGRLTSVLSSSVGSEIGVDPKVILETSHGRRSIDILKILAPEKANWECKCGVC